MKQIFALGVLFCCCGMLCASPYGKALQKARQVAGQAERRSAAQVAPPAPRQQAAANHEFKQLSVQIGEVARRNRGVLPGPSGIAGLKKLCGPGKVSPAILKINDMGRLTEKNSPWAYVGGELGALKRLPKDGGFPVLFSKAAPGQKEIIVLMADGSVKKLNAHKFRSAASVVKALRSASPRAKHPAWKKLSTAAGQIDRASR